MHGFLSFSRTSCWYWCSMDFFYIVVIHLIIAHTIFSLYIVYLANVYIFGGSPSIALSISFMHDITCPTPFFYSWWSLAYLLYLPVISSKVVSSSHSIHVVLPVSVFVFVCTSTRFLLSRDTKFRIRTAAFCFNSIWGLDSIRLYLLLIISSPKST